MKRAHLIVSGALLLFGLSSWGQMILTTPPTITLPVPGANGSMMISNGTDWVTDTNPAVKVDGTVPLEAPLPLWITTRAPGWAIAGSLWFMNDPDSRGFYGGYPGAVHGYPQWRKFVNTDDLANALADYLPVDGESDPIVGGVSGIIQSDGQGTISAVPAGGITATFLQNAPADLGTADVTVDLSNSSESYVTNLTIDGALTAGTLSVSNVPSVSAGIATPASTPAKLGDIFIDTDHLKIYIATGTSSSTDWTAVN